MSVYPELVSGARDAESARSWRVVPGSARRGGASCDFTRRVLEVPLGESAVERVVRAHELAHARVSPDEPVSPSELGVSARALECAEELRVNSLLGRLGFAVECLRDGTEAEGARRLAQSGAWSEVVCLWLAVLGTGGERPYLAAVRRVDATWASALVVVRRRVKAMLAEHRTSDLGATVPGARGLPRGYDVSVEIARMADRAGSARVPRDRREMEGFRRSLAPGGRRVPSGRPAPLVWAVPSSGVEPGGGRAPRAIGGAATGAVLRYPSRLLTDPSRRAFAHCRSRAGGIVIVDQSGSMDLDAAVLERVIARATRSLVVGYSHRPGDPGATPNAWIVADEGRVRSPVPHGNVGNGADQSVLEWSLRRRRPSEPVVWVTDGQVTDSNDQPDEAITRACARLVWEGRVRLVRSVDEAPEAIHRASSLVGTDLNRFGRVGRALGELVTR